MKTTTREITCAALMCIGMLALSAAGCASTDYAEATRAQVAAVAADLETATQMITAVDEALADLGGKIDLLLEELDDAATAEEVAALEQRMIERSRNTSAAFAEIIEIFDGIHEATGTDAGPLKEKE